jgi:hypothetical protein
VRARRMSSPIALLKAPIHEALMGLRTLMKQLFRVGASSCLGWELNKDQTAGNGTAFCPGPLLSHQALFGPEKERMEPVITTADVNSLLRPLLLKDLRIQCRARGLQPAGGPDALRDRICEVRQLRAREQAS